MQKLSYLFVKLGLKQMSNQIYLFWRESWNPVIMNYVIHFSQTLLGSTPSKTRYDYYSSKMLKVIRKRFSFEIHCQNELLFIITKQHKIIIVHAFALSHSIPFNAITYYLFILSLIKDISL